MIDRSAIGRTYPERVVEIERTPLRAFARAIGETDAVYTDVQAARRAGHRDLPVPPTYLFGFNLALGDGDFEWIAELGVDHAAVLHGEQSFDYHETVCAGDVVLVRPRIADIYERKAGALQFIVRETAIVRADGAPIADMRETLVVRERAR